ncbi:hypothetical protein SOCEGT47_020120 [Sorangium cellulosum]|jgi:hypothetical protein|uniref:Uncharacterized protein n=1 Tax=Sorangium cellulosum TaxID=56 RepID=A0A4P2PY80_SORCE|nr:hypothetical protein [Sorangium cellulosum]AUX21526.1 hypothetical protein SOCEGT47_020120 [Sorangium cellulosum]
MIHRQTGEIELSSGLRIGPSYSEAQFLSSSLARMAKALSRTQPWSGYRTSRQRIGHKTFRVTLHFCGGKLASLELFEVGAESKASWNDWSEREEAERKASHDAWLASMLGAPPYEYPWGKISSEHDPQGGYSSIVVRFGEGEAGGVRALAGSGSREG